MQPRHGLVNIIPLVYLLPFIILVEGFASIAVEILTIRQLLPVAGGSVVVTSVIIGVFLLFLALGYDWGGRVTARLETVLQRNFFITSVLVGVGLSYFFIMFFFQWAQHIVGSYLVYSLVAYLMLVLAPIVFLLGQTLPITMNIVRQEKSAGYIAGKALGLSTVGSFFGAILTTVVLMHYFGVAVSVFVVFSMLMLLALLLSTDTKTFFIKTVLAVFCMVVVYVLNIEIEKNSFVLTNANANYQILDSSNSTLQDGQRILLVNSIFSSKIDDLNNKSFDYVEIIKKILFNDMNLSNADVLVLGAGGFTISRNSDPDLHNHFTYVDIESKLKNILVPRFTRTVNETLVVDDARHYLIATPNQFDVIVVDVFSNTLAIPAHLATYEFMTDVRRKLKNGGTAIFNVIANPMLTDAYSKRIDNTIRRGFKSCVAIPTRYTDGISNIIYVCSNKPNQADLTVYRDNLNNVTLDAFGV